MMLVAAAGVVLNGTISWMLYRRGHKNDVNIRSALIHQVGDTLSTAAVIVGGAAIAFTGKQWIDPALSIGIAALVLWSSLDIVRETLNILLEGTPRGVDVGNLTTAMASVAGVNSVHDLHVWSLSSRTHALSCHISIADIPPSESEAILREVRRRLAHFGIVHTTIQFEHVDCEVAHGCVIPVDGGHPHVH
jgi:cobalt-zinc-cadmium efflux system protein